MQKVITLLVIFISINCYSQEIYKLKIESSGTFPAFEHIFDVRHYNEEDIKVYFSEYTGEDDLSETDSLRYRQLRYKKNRTAEDNREMMNIIDASKIFTKKCMVFSHEDRLIQLADSIINSKEEILFEIKNNKNRVIIDGIQVSVTVTNKSGIGYFYPIHNPDKKNYILFSEFLDEAYKFFPKP
ncbi:hypothetical protein LDL76_02130 [Salegentibacter mishustinae]|jgi:alpha-amylase/alpha-mannosidase (GH57 family)|uniref:hypothetical protein n=1 Tax=Salegentibacter mishustinae TaxID=270918 RepID=UPI001CE1FC7C|nr:hypothetical protein [Salegentibacter mishustinae]UBZ07514.1 hypothetical protein LDL76_02130 [Salegentibacter mishustinae]